MNLAAILLITLAGLGTWRLRGVARLNLPARLAIAWMSGMVFVILVMFVEAVIGVSWSAVALLLPIVAMVLLVRTPPRSAAPHRSLVHIATLGVIAISAYAAMTARETIADLLYFWGPKAVRFCEARTIDRAFLSDPFNYLMHPDYPPALPFVYAWSCVFGHGFSYWTALALAPVFLLATAAAFNGISRDAWSTLLLVAVLACASAGAMPAGGAEPMLLFFETVALAALTFADDLEPIAAIALTGAVLTKIEGAAFAVTIVVLYAVMRNRRPASFAIVVPAALVLAAWFAYVKHYGLIDLYRAGGRTVHWSILPVVAKETVNDVGYEASFTPWLAALIPLRWASNWERAAFPLTVGTCVVGYTVFVYLHEADPEFLIASSAPRLLLTALMCFAVAAAAGCDNRR